MKKTELLLPVGNTESFYAAIEGGADAIYLGLRNFNARNRAKNFTIKQLQSILTESKKYGIKVYLTLNTLIKNSELPELLDVLYQVSQTTLASIIIQDWGVYYLARKFFPGITLHASTQMTFHNSIGTEYANQKHFERVILARELTLEELKIISRKSKIELEIFTHGALCYSFSGLCLFSSFLGGMSANRGQCRQPCRRIYKTEDEENYFFSLKDNQQIEIVPELMKLGISALKVEGRMKSAEYVYRVAKAYRMVIDDPEKIEPAKQLLSYDMGRENTGYFLGGNVSNSITENPFIGINIGKVTKANKAEFSFMTSEKLKHNYRIRVQPQNGMDSKAIKLKAEYGFVDVDRNETVTLNYPQATFTKGDNVFLIGAPDKKFRTKFQLDGKKINLSLPAKKKQNILDKIGSGKQLHRDELFVRINSLSWLRKLYLDKFDQLILNLTKTEWSILNLESPFMRKNIQKFIVELPKFIKEDDIIFYRELCLNLSRQGIKNFMLSHISQKLLLPIGIRSSVNENVYSLNDAAIQFLKEDNTGLYIYPYEFDFDNLISGKNRNGIVPLYFYPELFHSRMPVKIDHPDPNGYTYFKDRDNTYRKTVRDGITIVIPELPVSLFQYKDDIHKNGFRRFLIDLSYEKPSQNTFNRLQKRYKYSEAEQPGYGFNFKLGLS
ncbi:MAG: peptidase U32 family protein [Candidatus Tenebribacter davisii]|nr:peptidase U32 family protein [Candidatus Tenebribacter davisii]